MSERARHIGTRFAPIMFLEKLICRFNSSKGFR